MSRPELPEVPTAADERTTLVAFLAFYRASLLDRAHGLDVEQLHTELAPSTLTIGRLIGHLAMVEEFWFRVRFAGEQPSAIWANLDYEDDRDAEMTLEECRQLMNLGYVEDCSHLN